MCGICGYVNNKKLPLGILKKMNDSLTHRGPDDSGEWELEENDFSIGFGHRRLSILDLSELGHQPMVSNSGNTMIVFNGEIYNFVKLKKQLSNYDFKTQCDTEVILAAYEEWDIDFLNHIDGMFSIALYDLKRKRLILTRDRIGKKSLYYYWKDGKLAFGSELKPILLFPEFEKNICSESIEYFMCYQYISSPKTIFENTYKLPAGHYAIYENGTLDIKKYWDLNVQFYTDDKIKDYNTCKQGLKNELKKSVSERLVSDVPVGAFLSGGIDSVLVTSLAQEISSDKLKTFTIGFHDKKRNEADAAAMIAKHLGTDHTELYVKNSEMLEMIDAMCQYYDEPFADPSLIPTMLVSKLAKTKVTVALSGDGGDEFFCGYSMYDFVKWSQKLDVLTGITNSILTLPGLKIIKNRLPQEAIALLNNRDARFKTQLFQDLPDSFVQRLLNKSFSTKYSIESEFKDKNWQERRMKLDMLTYLPEDVLVKTDRASMKYSLEVRCPILSRNVIEYSFRIPHEYKYKKSEKKFILKDILYDYVPKEMMDRPKNGFGVPLGSWLRNELKNEVSRFLDKDKLSKQGIFNYDVLCELIDKVEKSDQKPYPKILWSFLVFQKWYERYIEAWE